MGCWEVGTGVGVGRGAADPGPGLPRSARAPVPNPVSRALQSLSPLNPASWPSDLPTRSMGFFFGLLIQFHVSGDQKLLLINVG